MAWHCGDLLNGGGILSTAKRGVQYKSLLGLSRILTHSAGADPLTVRFVARRLLRISEIDGGIEELEVNIPLAGAHSTEQLD
jgi:hypothetical protein